jgi:hypothetical protein
MQTGIALAQLSLPFQKKVRALPKAFEKPDAATNLNNSKPKTGSPWVVFSDRDDNFTTTTPGGSLFMKKLTFMEPFYVAQEKNGYLKLIKYNPGLLNGRKINNKKAATSYGWISRWKVLMWNRSFTNPQNGYPEKAITVVNGKLPLVASNTYYDHTDSAYVYSSPELKRVVGKVRLHQLEYIYKRSEDNRKYLVGGEDQLVADSAAKAIYGWIAADAVHTWGQRLYIAPLQDAQVDTASVLLYNEHADPLLGKDDVILKGAPVLKKGSVGKAIDVYNKSHNTLITIDGSSLQYPAYFDLREHIHQVNVVFVLDGSGAMKQLFPGLTNTIQSLENVFREYDSRHQVHFGAVVYRDSIETTGGIYPDYRKLMRFLGKQAVKTAQGSSDVHAVPLYAGIDSALSILRPHHNETNLVILIGSVGDSTSHFNGLSERFGKQNARLLAMQMYSDYNEWFNNFVLNAKRLVSESAVYSAAIKKQFLINGERLDDNQLYNTSEPDSLSFFLDYPENSLVQGGVIFPTKGGVNTNRNIFKATRRFLQETDYDIRTQITSLDSAFRLRGVEHGNLSAGVSALLPAPVDSTVADQLPHNGFKYFTTADIPANLVESHPDQLQYMLVLNSTEYKQMNDIIAFLSGQNLQQDANSFRRKLYRNYLSIPRHLLDLRVHVKELTLEQYFQAVTGFPLSNNLLGKYKVTDLKRNMPQQDFENYLHFLINSADNIKMNTQAGQQFISNGKTYYYITRNNFMN